MSVLDADIRDPEGWQVFLFGLGMLAIGALLATAYVGRPILQECGTSANVILTANGTYVAAPQTDGVRMLTLINKLSAGVALASFAGVLAIDYWVMES